MVQGHKFPLYVGASAHLLGGAEQHPYLPGTHLAEQFFLLHLRVGGVDIGYFFGWYALGNQFVPQVIVDVKLHPDGGYAQPPRAQGQLSQHRFEAIGTARL